MWKLNVNMTFPCTKQQEGRVAEQGPNNGRFGSPQERQALSPWTRRWLPQVGTFSLSYLSF